jgi:TonB family protein
VTSCTVTSSSGSASLDAATCRIMTERARFIPARDRRGRAVADSLSARVRWVLPEDGEPLARDDSAGLAALIGAADYSPEAIVGREQGRVGFALDVAGDGSVQGCRVTASSGSADLDSRTCALLSARARFVPASDAEGRPRATIVTGAIDWQLPR